MQPFRENKIPFALWMLLLPFLAVSCNYTEVEVKEIRKVQINNFDSKGIEITATMQVVNPNNYKVQVTGTDADIYLNGKKAGKAVLLQKVVSPPNSDKDLAVRLRADFDSGSASLLPMLFNAAMGKKVEIRAVGKIRVKSVLIGKNIDFDETHKAQF